MTATAKGAQLVSAIRQPLLRRAPISCPGPSRGCANTFPQFGISTQTLNGWLGSTGQRGGFNPLYQIGPRSIRLALKLQF